MRRFRSFLTPGVDKQLLVKDAAKLLPDPARRRFIAGGASLGALTLLTGCEVSDSFSAERLLIQISKFNDKVQAAIFNPNTLAPTYAEADITRPFPFNGYYAEEEAPDIDGEDYKFGKLNCCGSRNGRFAFPFTKRGGGGDLPGAAYDVRIYANGAEIAHGGFGVNGRGGLDNDGQSDDNDND